MKKPSKKAVTVAGFAIVGSIAAATVAVKRHKSKTAPKKEEERPDDTTLFV